MHRETITDALTNEVKISITLVFISFMKKLKKHKAYKKREL